jgi:hypothetical protein
MHFQTLLFRFALLERFAFWDANPRVIVGWDVTLSSIGYWFVSGISRIQEEGRRHFSLGLQFVLLGMLFGVWEVNSSSRTLPFLAAVLAAVRCHLQHLDT